MENTQKTPEQWFQKLKEPYRSEILKHVAEYNRDELYESIDYAIYCCVTASFKDRDVIYDSIKAGETTYLEPETLKPEQMESGKWYVVVDDNICKWLIKFKYIDKYDRVFINKYCYDLTDDVDRTDSNNNFCFKEDVKSIRPATSQEVLKYFPDEVFEPIELRPEDLKAGEVYTIFDEKLGKFVFKYKAIEDDELGYEVMYCFTDNKKWYDLSLSYEKTDKIYHATPEEKALLGRETTDLEYWKKRAESATKGLEGLQKDYDNLNFTYQNLMKIYQEQDLKYDALADRYTKLEAYNDELTERINQAEIKNNQEKVYVHYNIKHEKWLQAESLELALQESPDNKNIYEAVCIGKKKSVLVSE